MIQIHECQNIGLTMERATVEEKIDACGQRYFEATAKIGSIFGSEVEGQCTGIGATPEIALERLKKDQADLAESLWE